LKREDEINQQSPPAEETHTPGRKRKRTRCPANLHQKNVRVTKRRDQFGSKGGGVKQRRLDGKGKRQRKWGGA